MDEWERRRLVAWCRAGIRNDTNRRLLERAIEMLLSRAKRTGNLDEAIERLRPRSQSYFKAAAFQISLATWTAARAPETVLAKGALWHAVRDGPYPQQSVAALTTSLRTDATMVRSRYTSPKSAQQRPLTPRRPGRPVHRAPEYIDISLHVGFEVSALLQIPSNARACYVLGHGAGAGMDHPFMEAVAGQLAERGIATLRFQFPFMERGSRRADGPELAHAAVCAAVGAAREHLNLPLFAGGKSYGGRMTSQAQAASPLANVLGLAFLGFPLHPAGRPGRDRGSHLFQVQAPMLFLQGTRDALAVLDELRPLCEDLGDRATLVLLEGADHSFRVLSRSGRTDAQVMADAMDALALWIDGTILLTTSGS